MNEQNTTVIKTWLVIDNLFKHRSERHCRHTVDFIVQEALTKSKSAGLAAQTQQPTDAATTRGQSKWKLHKNLGLLRI